jgi:HD-GYP domain-containing protein (c-di-GMP phosphodiesterase class II)
MTAERPYSAALTTEEALTELRNGAGTQFDPEVALLLERVLRSTPAELLPVPRPAPVA